MQQKKVANYVENINLSNNITLLNTPKLCISSMLSDSLLIITKNHRSSPLKILTQYLAITKNELPQ